jgi:hypothetical protein
MIKKNTTQLCLILWLIPCYSFGQYTGGSGKGDANSTSNPNSPLPILLKEFTSTCKNGMVELNWSTYSEINNARFYIHRSSDMINWQMVAQLPGSGNSYNIQTYKVVDKQPLKEGNYYRLTQVDYNGSSESFNTKAELCNDDFTEEVIRVFPNPALGKFSIIIYLPNVKESTGEIQLTDINGRMVNNRSLSLSEGTTEYYINDQNIKPGIYFVRLLTESLISQPVKLVLR